MLICITYSSTLVPLATKFVLPARCLTRYHRVLFLSDGIVTLIGRVNLHHYMMLIELSLIRGWHLSTIAEEEDEVIRHDGDNIFGIWANGLLALNHEHDRFKRPNDKKVPVFVGIGFQPCKFPCLGFGFTDTDFEKGGVSV